VESAIAKLVIVGVMLAALSPPALAQKRILTCKDDKGRTVIADPSDPRCYTPPPGEDAKAADEERKRKAKEAYLACKAEQRSNQSLVSRYPDKQKHDAAREQALSQAEATLTLSQKRMEQLLAERQRLRNEAEFYPKGNLPPKLKRDIDSNTALIEAQTDAIATQKADAAQKNTFYDDELAKLKKLWSPQADRRACVVPPD
jgi:hypothetical protein